MSLQIEQTKFTQAVGNADEINELLRRYGVKFGIYTRTKKQTILIHWNFIGAVELPQEQKTSAQPDFSKLCRYFYKI